MNLDTIDLNDILIPTERSVEPRVGQIGYTRMFPVPTSIDESARTMRFRCSTGNIDRYGEIVLPEAYRSSLDTFMLNPVFMAGHVYVAPDGGATSIGHWIELNIDKDGLDGVSKFLADDPLAEGYWRRYRSGAQRAVSVGFITKAFEMRSLEVNGQKQLVRVFTDVELIEISAVAIPANRESLVRQLSAVRSADGGGEQGMRALIRDEVQRAFAREFDVSPSGRLCMLIESVVAALHGRSAGVDIDAYYDADSRGMEPDPGESDEGDDQTKAMLRQTLALLEPGAAQR